MHERHQGQEPVVGDAENAHLGVAFGNILDQPVDGVVGVGRFVDRGGILRPVQWPVHHVIAFGAILAADVFDHADIAAFEDHVGGVVIAVERRSEVGAVQVGGLRVGAVRSAREQDGGMLRAIRNEDDGMQLHAVPHGNHGLASRIVEARGGRFQLGRRFAGEIGILRLRRRICTSASDEARTRVAVDEAQGYRRKDGTTFQSNTRRVDEDWIELLCPPFPQQKADRMGHGDFVSG